MAIINQGNGRRTRGGRSRQANREFYRAAASQSRTLEICEIQAFNYRTGEIEKVNRSFFSTEVRRNRQFENNPRLAPYSLEESVAFDQLKKGAFIATSNYLFQLEHYRIEPRRGDASEPILPPAA